MEGRVYLCLQFQREKRPSLWGRLAILIQTITLEKLGKADKVLTHRASTTSKSTFIWSGIFCELRPLDSGEVY